MNADDNDPQLHEMLARSYESLREPVAGEREAVLARLSQARSSAPTTRGRAWGVRIAWLATAACIAVAVAVRMLPIPSTSQVVYGLEAVPKRLLEVQTIRIRGLRMVYDDANPQNPPIPVAVEYLVKRPDKFRGTSIAVSQGNGPVEIRRSSHFCDGRFASNDFDTQKQYSIKPLSPLDARIRTEMRAQQFIVGAVLGPPEAPYKKMGHEKVSGRACDIYEGRFGEGDNATIAKLWFDPANGYPVRMIHDSVQPDGTSRRDMEYDEISVNVPLDDELFRFTPPEDYQRLGPAPDTVARPQSLDPSPTGSGSGGGATLEAWHALRIADNAALLVWRRSEPEAKADGTRDWLSHIEMNLEGPQDERALLHAWLYESRSPDRWNWSLVVVSGGQLPEHGSINLELRSEKSHHTQGMLALRFPDAELEVILAAAGRATLPADAPQLSLAEIRARAVKLLDAKTSE